MPSIRFDSQSHANSGQIGRPTATATIKQRHEGFPSLDPPALRTLVPLLLSVIVAIGASVALGYADNGTTRARVQQIDGFNRGPIIDRNGKVLARTAWKDGNPVRDYSLESSAGAIGYRD